MAENHNPHPRLSEVRRRPCPICDGSSFFWGFFSPGSHPFSLKTDDDSWWVRNTGLGGTAVEARACETCGNIQMFLKQ